jgi:hypothetical protein
MRPRCKSISHVAVTPPPCPEQAGASGHDQIPSLDHLDDTRGTATRRIVDRRPFRSRRYLVQQEYYTILITLTENKWGRKYALTCPATRVFFNGDSE